GRRPSRTGRTGRSEGRGGRCAASSGSRRLPRPAGGRPDSHLPDDPTAPRRSFDRASARRSDSRAAGAGQELHHGRVDLGEGNGGGAGGGADQVGAARLEFGAVSPGRGPEAAPHAVTDDGRTDAPADRVGDTGRKRGITRKERHRNRTPATAPSTGQRLERRPVADPPDQALSL